MHWLEPHDTLTIRTSDTLSLSPSICPRARSRFQYAKNGTRNDKRWTRSVAARFEKLGSRRRERAPEHQHWRMFLARELASVWANYRLNEALAAPWWGYPRSGWIARRSALPGLGEVEGIPREWGSTRENRNGRCSVGSAREVEACTSLRPIGSRATVRTSTGRGYHVTSS